jgi:formiminoglutamase
MARINPPDVRAPDTAAHDERVGHLLGRQLRDGAVAQAVIVGFPSDEGVCRNGGRAGAAAGPGAIRSILYRLTPDARYPPFEDLLARTQDLGDLDVTGNVESDQEALGAALASHVGRDTFLIVLGGGHETSYGHFLGYALGGKRVEILNWDAHADVREMPGGQAHSGSPFRQACEHPSGACRRYSVAGLLPHAVARSHLEYVERHGSALWRDEISLAAIDSLYERLEGPALVSFDLDAVSQAEAPGVSAPNPAGLPAALWLEAAYRAGRTSAVTSADVVELNPRFDRDGQTARLAALTVWWLLRGRAERR